MGLNVNDIKTKGGWGGGRWGQKERDKKQKGGGGGEWGETGSIMKITHGGGGGGSRHESDYV